MRSKEQKKAFEVYVLSCITPENYEMICKTDRDRLEFVQTTFEREYGHEIARRGQQRAFEEWLKGLPSSIGIDFENYRIIELAKQYGFIPVNATVRQEDRALELWWGSVYMAFRRMLERKPARVRKTRDEFEIQGLYYGTWECVTTEDSRIEARTRLKEYRENERGTAFRMIRKRVKIEEVAA